MQKKGLFVTQTSRRFTHDPLDGTVGELRDVENPISPNLGLHELQLPVELQIPELLGIAYYELVSLIRYWKSEIMREVPNVNYYFLRCPKTRTLVHWDQVEAISWPGHDNDLAVAMRIAQRDSEVADEDAWLQQFRIQCVDVDRVQMLEKIENETRKASVRIRTTADDFHRKLRDAAYLNLRNDQIAQPAVVVAPPVTAPIVTHVVPAPDSIAAVMHRLLNDQRAEPLRLLTGGLIGMAAGAALARWQIARATHGTGVVHRGPHR